MSLLGFEPKRTGILLNFSKRLSRSRLCCPLHHRPDYLNLLIYLNLFKICNKTLIFQSAFGKHLCTSAFSNGGSLYLCSSSVPIYWNSKANIPELGSHFTLDSCWEATYLLKYF